MEYFDLPYDPYNQQTLSFEGMFIVSTNDYQWANFNETPVPGKFNSYAFCHFIKCSGEIFLDGERIELRDGLLLLIQPGQMLTRINMEEQGIEVRMVYITKEFMLQIDKRLLDLSYVLSEQLQYIHLTPEQNGRLMEFGVRLEQEYRSDWEYRDLMLKVYLTELMVMVERGLKRHEHGREHNMHPLMLRFLALLSEEEGGRRNVSWYADKLSVTPKYLNDIVKAESGRTIKSVLKERSLQEAQRLLISSDMSIQNIAFALNFSSHVYFSSFFKQMTGETPMQYRNRYQGVGRKP